MVNHVQLNNIDHANLKVLTEKSEALGDNTWYGLTFPGEFRIVQSCYPIFFQKNTQDNSWMALALFGFEKGENLFLKGNTWDANYIPMSVQRDPFLIGKSETQNEYGERVEQRVVHVDMDSPRLSHEKGIPLFSELGAETPYLEKIARTLETIHHGLINAKEFFKSIEELDLIEPLTLEITLNDGSKNQLIGFSTINEEKFRKLGDADIVRLNREGFLEAIYMVLASMTHISALIERRNSKDNF